MAGATSTTMRKSSGRRSSGVAARREGGFDPIVLSAERSIHCTSSLTVVSLISPRPTRTILEG